MEPLLLLSGAVCEDPRDHFGKECKRAMKSKSGGRQGAAERGAVGGVGGVPLGCRRFHVVLLLGARLEEVRT